MLLIDSKVRSSQNQLISGCVWIFPACMFVWWNPIILYRIPSCKWTENVQTQLTAHSGLPHNISYWYNYRYVCSHNVGYMMHYIIFIYIVYATNLTIWRWWSQRQQIQAQEANKQHQNMYNHSKFTCKIMRYSMHGYSYQRRLVTLPSWYINPVSDIINYLKLRINSDIMPYNMLGDADCTARSLEQVWTSIGQSNVPVLTTACVCWLSRLNWLI